MAACRGDGAPAFSGNLAPLLPAGPPETPFTIRSRGEAIGGPLAQGRAGDQLLANDRIRVVIQQPGKYPGVGSFGGNIIDADRVRQTPTASSVVGRQSSVQNGNDQFGVMAPLINIEWTVNGIAMFAVPAFDPATFDPSTIQNSAIHTQPAVDQPRILVVQGIIDTYDFLDIDFLEPLAKALTGQTLYYASRFDDMNEPFKIYDLKQLQIDVTTAYRLDPGSRAVQITTTLFNNGDTPVQLPVGDFVNGSGELELLIPGLGFTPPLLDQIQGDTPGLIYKGMAGVDVSYGYFYDLREFTESGDASKRAISTSLTYSGVTGVLLGEEFTKIFPLGGGKTPTIRFAVPPHARRTLTRYFVVGDGSAGSVLDEGLRVLKIPTRVVRGRVVDTAGAPVAGADVALLNEKGHTVVTYRTDGGGAFEGRLSTGADPLAQVFGGGVYTLRVDKPGYHLAGTAYAGRCGPETVDLRAAEAGEIKCTLGASGVVTFDRAAVDAESGAPIPVRLTILGIDPSPDRVAPGVFHDQTVFHRPFGIVDVVYLNANGRLGLAGEDSLRLEPGAYLFSFTHGPEYSMEVRSVTVPGYGITPIAPVALRRVVATPGFIGADFHVHALPSPDSAMAPEQRVLAAAAEGLDVLHSSDHDFLFDYTPVVRSLETQGLIIPGAMGTIVGDEISPNQLGHIHAFPLVADPSRPNGGALDWSLSTHDAVGPDPDFMLTVQEIIDAIRALPGGEKVLQVNHISERSTSLFLLSGLVTTAAYRESHHVEPLSTYAEPIALRLPAPTLGGLPLPMGGGVLFSPDFTAVELAIGEELQTNLLRESALPQWFNLLNLGMIVTATADSDSHTPIAAPLGLPRNYIASPLDPRDGMGGDLRALDADAYAHAINGHQVIVSAGPFVRMEVVGESGTAGVGEVIRTQKPVVKILVTAPAWAWFDTIEIYANTVPTPVDDDGIGVLRGVAADPAHFHAPYHLPLFTYAPQKTFRLADGSLKDWRLEHGVIRATVETPLEVDQDTWVVAMVRGTPDTPGFRPLFPFTVASRVEAGKEPELPVPFTLNDFVADPAFAAPAWAFTNPIFIDVDGDTNNDGHPFEPIYIKQGTSPLAPH